MLDELYFVLEIGMCNHLLRDEAGEPARDWEACLKLNMSEENEGQDRRESWTVQSDNSVLFWHRNPRTGEDYGKLLFI